MSNPVLVVDGLSKQYGPVTAVDQVSFSVSAGEVFGLLGPNGAGKSTTLDALIGFTEPTSGGGAVTGHDIVESSTAVRSVTGVLPEDCGVYEELTAVEHVELAARAKEVDSAPERLLSRVGLTEESWSRPAGGFSKGMAQRLRLAVALVGDPALLVLDEPLSGVDPDGIAELARLIEQIAETGVAVVFSSHDLPRVERVCDRVGILNDGEFVGVERLTGDRTTELILSTDTHPRSSALSELRALDGVEQAGWQDGGVHLMVTEPTAKAEAVQTLGSHTRVRDIRTRERSLDEIFAAYTASEERDDTDVATRREVTVS